MAELADIAVPIASTAAGGVSVVWIAKLLIQNWIAKQDKDSDVIRDVDKKMAVVLHRLDTIEKDINNLGNALRSARRLTPEP